jgi:CheY-like chemotaxis protein
MDGKLRILLVDDDRDLVGIWQQVLTEAGYEVETAGDGEEGLVKVRQGGYQLVLLDGMMPKLDGIGFLEKLSRINPKPIIGPIVMVSNLAPDVVAENAARWGASGCISKVELDPGQLVNQVKKFIQ